MRTWNELFPAVAVSHGVGGGRRAQEEKEEDLPKLGEQMESWRGEAGVMGKDLILLVRYASTSEGACISKGHFGIDTSSSGEEPWSGWMYTSYVYSIEMQLYASMKDKINKSKRSKE